VDLDGVPVMNAPPSMPTTNGATMVLKGGTVVTGRAPQSVLHRTDVWIREDTICAIAPTGSIAPSPGGA
jgi:hypothetical protein